MSTTKIKRLRILITLLVTFFLIVGTLVAIKFAKGYRPNIKEGQLNGTGLLSVTSYPKGAKVMINDKLTTVADDTLYLKPQTYKVEIKKEGFTTWSKEIPIKEELVSNANARLFPSLASITPVTYTGIVNPVLNHDHSKIAYVVVGNESTEGNGIYIMSLASNLISSFSTIQIVNNQTLNYADANLFWSPDSTQILAIFEKDKVITAAQLLNTSSENKTRDIVDVTIRLNLILSQWQEELDKSNQSAISKLPEKFQEYIKSNQIINYYLSPDQEKLLYQANKDFKLGEKITGKDLPAINSTTQDRDLKIGNIYVYDTREDTNYQIKSGQTKSALQKKVVLTSQEKDKTSTQEADQTPKAILAVNENDDLITQFKTLASTNDSSLTLGNIFWYTTSSHLIKTSEDKVEIVEYDNQNSVTLFQTDIQNNFAAPSTNGTNLIILSSLNQKDQATNLFSLDLK